MIFLLNLTYPPCSLLLQGGLQSPGDGLPGRGGQHDRQLLPPRGGPLRTNTLDTRPHPPTDSGRRGRLFTNPLPPPLLGEAGSKEGKKFLWKG